MNICRRLPDKNTNINRGIDRILKLKNTLAKMTNLFIGLTRSLNMADGWVGKLEDTGFSQRKK